jgi:CXCXC repeat
MPVVGFVLGKTNLLVPEKGVRTMSAEDRNGQVSTDEECTDCTTEQRSFDALARGLANGTVSRRKAFRLFGAALASAAVAVVVPDRASAHHNPGHVKCLGPGSKCATNSQCCSANCALTKEGKICGCPLDLGQEVICSGSNQQTCNCICTGNSCANGCCLNNICQGGNTVEACGRGGELCNACTTNVTNAHPVCNNGQCGFECNLGFTQCGNQCVNIATDTANCGQCNNACPTPANASAATCVGGQCGFVCNAGFANCDANAANGCETNLLTDEQNCGTCGNRCASGATCTNGACFCPTGEMVCGATATDPGTCRNLNTDVNNCGQCGTSCQGSKVCVAGQCVCPADPTCLAPKVVNPNTCACECPAINCSGSKVLNPNTCVCECPNTCTSPKVLNTSTCACECPADPTCLAPKVVNPSTCVCECPNTCTAPQVQNPTTCECFCPPAQVCGSSCCSSNQVCCPAGTRRAGSCRGNVGACN